MPRDFFFNFLDFFFNCDVTTVTRDPNRVSHCLYAAFSHFRHFNATRAFLGMALRACRILQDAGVSLHAAGSSLTAIPLDEQFVSGEASGGGDSPQMSLEVGTDLWLVGLVVSGFTLCKEQAVPIHLHFCRLLPCLQAPIQGIGVQNSAELRGLGPPFNISPVLIWVKGISPSPFIEKKVQSFCILPSSS